MKSVSFRLALLLYGTLLVAGCALNGKPVTVELEDCHGSAMLLRGGEPYFIKGAGGSASLELLRDAGGNSVRTWGAPDKAYLDTAHSLGLTVCVGLWIQHERHGFDYDDPAAYRKQLEAHKRTIDTFKDHPAVLLWGIGNEVEINYTNKKVWQMIEEVAAYAKMVDPHHPTMTVTAHPSVQLIEEIQSRVPSVDILGVNSYGGLGMIRGLVEAHWRKPYIITEWGPDGNWEVPKTPWGAEMEITSTEKASQRAMRYIQIAADRRYCLGSYAFHWGYKQETTPTWFNFFLEDGTPTESLEVLAGAWGGSTNHPPAPRIGPIELNGVLQEAGLRVEPGASMTAAFALLPTSGHKENVRWEVLPESQDKRIGGDKEQRPEAIDLQIQQPSRTTATFHAPSEPGPYRLFLYVYGMNKQSVATANFPFLVK